MNSSSRGWWPSSTTPADGSGADPSRPVEDGAGPVDANRERAGDDGLLEYLHPDGSLTRIGDSTSSSLSASIPAVAQDGSNGEIRLDLGSLWHQTDPASPAGQSFDIHLPGARIVTRDATFAVVVEADGSSFITSVAGAVSVHGADAGPAHVAPLEAALLSPEGQILDAIRAEPHELAGDPWVGLNLRQSELDPATVRLPGAPAPRFEPTPAPAPEDTSGWRMAPLVEAETVAAATSVEQDTGGQAADDVPAAPDRGTIDIDAALARAGIGSTAIADPPGITEPAAITEPPAITEPAAITEPPAADQPQDIAEQGELPEVEALGVAAPESTETFDRGRLFPEAEATDVEAERSNPIRAIGGVVMVVVGVIIVVLVMRSLLHNDATSVSTSATTVVTTASTVAKPSTVPTTAAASSTTAAVSRTTVPATTVSTAATATTASGGPYTVTPTLCSQSTTTLSADGTIRNRDKVAHSYQITVAFTSDGTTQVATAVAAADHVAAGASKPWTGSTPYSGQISKTTGGCRVIGVTTT